jgi:hypothetical protein
MNRISSILILCICPMVFSLGGCKTVYDVNRTPKSVLAAEPTLGFLRPDRYSILGTRSVRDYVEVTYERTQQNESGMLEVQLGLRDRGGQHFWDTRGPAVTISVKATFYADPVDKSGPTGPAVYETNWQPVRIIRGDTVGYKALCPVRSGQYYQIRMTDMP